MNRLLAGTNRVWAYDFASDACADGQQLKCLTVIDGFTQVPGNRRGGQHPLGSRDQSAGEVGEHSRRAAVSALGFGA